MLFHHLCVDLNSNMKIDLQLGCDHTLIPESNDPYSRLTSLKVELESIVAGSFRTTTHDSAEGQDDDAGDSDDKGFDPFAHMRRGHGGGGAGPQVQCAQQ